jgi:4-hydroxyphenylpyruvate dioxygenase
MVIKYQEFCMSDNLNNPLGTERFAFVEFTSPRNADLLKLFRVMGFETVAHHKKRDIQLLRQGDIDFIINNDTAGQSTKFNAEHVSGGANAIGFKVKDAGHAFTEVLKRGATPAKNHGGSMSDSVPAIEGIGGSLIYLIDNPDMYESDFDFIHGVEAKPKGMGLTYIDHLTHNVNKGNMEGWANFYEKFFNFHQQQFFDINGNNGTGLLSMAMSGPCLELRIPLNEDKGTLGSEGQLGQIDQYLEDFPGEGIQHIALGTNDIYKTVEDLRNNGFEFLPTPKHQYYEQSDKRCEGHRENIPKLEELGILIDGAESEGILLQLFTKNVIGPVFFEVIQRKGNKGFGHGNFAALFGTLEEMDLENYRKRQTKQPS